MLRNLSQIELTIENKICRFMCDMDTPLPIVKEALFQFQSYVAKIEENFKEQQRKQEEEKESQPDKVEDGNQQ